MVDINKLVNKYTTPKIDNIQSLFEVISQVSLLNERATRELTKNLDASEQKSINIPFPKPRISEDFGKIGTDDRATIEKFAANIAGDTLEENVIGTQLLNERYEFVSQIKADI